MRLFHTILCCLPIFTQSLSGYFLFQENYASSSSHIRPSATLIATRKLIRPENCLPTAALNIAGACIVAGKKSLATTPFLASVLITQSIMASSMIINDIFDVHIDRVNNQKRPLVTGDVSIHYAIGLASALIFSAEFMNFRHIPKTLRHITHISTCLAIFYTPIFKRILLLKNVSCASMVALSVLFSGFAVASNNINIPPHRAFPTLVIAARLIFIGSFCSEILLDICDRDGDKSHGVVTLPVLFGNKAAWQMAHIAMHLNIMTSTAKMMRVYDMWRGYGLLFICAPILRALRNVKTQNYSQESIVEYCRKTTAPMITFLVYLYWCSRG